MKKLVLIAAAAACLLTAPTIMQPAGAETYIRSSDGWRHDDNWRHRGYSSRASVVVTSPHHCRTVTTRIREHGRTIIKKVRRCG
jgi:hypothetical protein